MKPEARIEALDVLYAADRVRAEATADSITGLSAKASRLVDGVREHRVAIDEAIEAVAIDWRIERMPAVDRTVLRIAVYEILFTDTPPAVVINEAVEIAKTYSTERSGPFVNGVLDTVARNRADRTYPDDGTMESADL
ncbi:MAG: transcription antitermination factor NusB [Acidimicrobiia bacterium]|nr:transcription antitermination factor NusB [Acidimicrobiia bacterium]